MYKTSNKVVSTPKREVPNTSCSISDIKYTSSDSITQKNDTSIKECTFDDSDNKKKIKRKRKFSKIKTNKKIRCFNKRGRRFVISETSDSESDIEIGNKNLKNVNVPRLLQNKDTNEQNQRKLTCNLFESPERIRDTKYNDHDNLSLSPSLISGGSNIHLSSIKNIANKENYQENNIFLDQDIKEIDISPISRKSNQIKKYPPAKRTIWKKNLLKNTVTEDWPLDYQVSTHYADLLWDKYVKDHSDEFPQHFQANLNREVNTEKSDTDKTDDTDGSLEILNILDERELKLFKSKPFCRIKGSLNKETKLSSINIDKIMYVSNDKNDSKSKKKKYLKGKWIRKKETFDYKSSDSSSDIQEKSFNEFNAKLKMKKKKKSYYNRLLSSRNKNHSCYSLPSSSSSLINNPKVKIKSVQVLKSKKYERGSNEIQDSVKVNDYYDHYISHHVYNSDFQIKCSISDLLLDVSDMMNLLLFLL